MGTKPLIGKQSRRLTVIILKNSGHEDMTKLFVYFYAVVILHT
jgi:hypothetical protein